MIKTLLRISLIVSLLLNVGAFTARADVTYVCDIGAAITIAPGLGLMFYNDRDHVYSFNYAQYKNQTNGQQVYHAKHGPIEAVLSLDNNMLFVKWDKSPNCLIFKRVNGTLNNNRHRLRSVNHPIVNAAKQTADANYAREVAPYQNTSPSYTTPAPSTPSYNNMPTEVTIRCEFCGGDGVSPIAKDTGSSLQKWCDKCHKMTYSHYHERCPNCNGTGYVKRLR